MFLSQHDSEYGAGVHLIALEHLWSLPDVLWVSDNHHHSTRLSAVRHFHPVLTGAGDCMGVLGREGGVVRGRGGEREAMVESKGGRQRKRERDKTVT